jgi:hypothetical protein
MKSLKKAFGKKLFFGPEGARALPAGRLFAKGSGPAPN